MSERLDVVPAEFFVHRHVYGKWACQCCKQQGEGRLLQEPAEPQIIDKGMPAPGPRACAMGLWRKTAMPRRTVFYFASQLCPTPHETAINYGGWVPGLSAPPTRFPCFDALVIYSLDLAQPVLTQPKVCPPIPQKC